MHGQTACCKPRLSIGRSSICLAMDHILLSGYKLQQQNLLLSDQIMSLLGVYTGKQLSVMLAVSGRQVLDIAATSCVRPCMHAEKSHLDPGRHSSQEVNEQAGVFSIIACHKVAIHHKAFSQVACDDESSVKQQCNIQREQETCKNKPE